MLHHHGGAGSPYTVSPTAEAVAFSLPPPPAGPISFTSIQPPPTHLQPTGTSAFAEFPIDGSSCGGAANNLHDDDYMPANVGVSETIGAGASGSCSTRWPREETLALIRIRSEMDVAFRNAPLKAPLWEDVARKLAALGYRRSAKKCKEKFENVDKYYRRTKEARAGRQDGKSYRFFSELEALHAAAPQQRQQQDMAQADPQPSGTMAWTTATAHAALAPPGPGLPSLSFSSMSGSESDSDNDIDGAEDDLGKGVDSECDREVMALFEGMMRRVTEKQDEMQRAFLETLERWESERTAREEAWRRQEVARMNREREHLARERAAAASRDSALITFLHRVGGGGLPPPPPPSAATAAPAAIMPSSPRHDAATSSLQVAPPLPPKSEEAWAWAGGGGESGGGGSSTLSSRWPKEEVQALIQLRTEKEEQYNDAGGSNSKGPLWEDIAAGMRRIGYNRSAKRCKEKWENINKYFKKVKESNKRRPEDSKTCPYFHQLDAMYRKKKRVAGSGQASPSQREIEGKSSNDAGKQNIVEVTNVHDPIPPGNSETAPATIIAGNGAESKKAEDTMMETNVQLQQQEFAADETDSDDMDYSDEGNDGDRMQYETGFQKANVTGSIGNTPAPTETAAAATSSAAAPTSTTFLAVQ